MCHQKSVLPVKILPLHYSESFVLRFVVSVCLEFTKNVRKLTKEGVDGCHYFYKICKIICLNYILATIYEISCMT